MKILFLTKMRNKRELMQMAQEKRKRPKKRRRSVPKSQTLTSQRTTKLQLKLWLKTLL